MEMKNPCAALFLFCGVLVFEIHDTHGAATTGRVVLLGDGHFHRMGDIFVQFIGKNDGIGVMETAAVRMV